jgi:WD40 repeat protein/serine/threonine protein kinase
MGTWAQRELLLEQFEQAWHDGQSPGLEEFLRQTSQTSEVFKTSEVSDHPSFLADLIQIDLENRLRQGEEARVEAYLERHPELAADTAVVLTLIDHEFSLRCRRGDHLSPREYLKRFPAHRDELQRHFGMEGDGPDHPTHGRLGPGLQAPATERVSEQGKPAVTEPIVLPSIPGYQLLEEIGRGGMSVVWKARDLALNRIVAVKVLRSGPYAEPVDLVRFHQEAETIARLRHANIVQIYEIGSAQGYSYLVLEHVDGPSLWKIIAGQPQPPLFAAALLEIVARAVHFAHQHGIIHRDLKSANILLSLADGAWAGDTENAQRTIKETGPRKPPEAVPVPPRRDLGPPAPNAPKIADFGLAKFTAADSDLTQSGAILGTPSYMAPEQADGKAAVGPPADIYSLGVILYEMLTGAPPFRGTSVFDTLEQVRSQEPVAPSRLQPKVPRDLETICLKCLQKDPRKRYTTAQELAGDLQRFQAGEPIRARPVGLPARVRKWVRRNPASAALVGVLGLLPLLLVAGALLHSASLQQTVDRLEKQARDRQQQVRQARYDDDLRAAHQFLLGGEVGEAAGYLAHHNDSSDSGPAHFVWRYLWHQVQLRRWSHAPRDAVRWLDVSPDGHTVALACVHGPVQLLDAATGRPRQTLPARDTLGLAFSPDGRTLATAEPDGGFRLWNLAGKPAPRWLRGPPSRDGCLAWTPDSASLATAAGGEITLWDVKAGHPARRWPAHTRAITTLAFGPDPRALASGGLDKMVRIWDPQTREATQSLKLDAAVRFVAFGPTGRWLAIVSGANTLTVWNRFTGERYDAGRHPGALRMAAFAPSGRYLASAGADGTILIWDLLARKKHLVLRDEVEGMRLLAFAPQANLLVSAGGAVPVRLWDIEAPGQRRSLAPPAPTGPMAFGPGGKLLAFAAADQSVRLLDLKRGQLTGVFTGNASPIRSVALSPDGKLLATGAEDGTVQVWEITTHQVRALMAGHLGRVEALVFTPDGSRLISGGEDAKVIVWDLASWRPLHRLQRHTGGVQVLALTSDAKLLASGGRDGSIRLWDPATGKHLDAAAVDGAVEGLAFLPDGKSMVGGTAESHSLFTIVPGPRLGAAQKFNGGCSSLALAPAGDQMVLGGQAGFAQWELKGRDPIATTLSLPNAPTRVLLSPDGRTLATHNQGRLLLWDLKTWSVRCPLGQQPGPVIGLAFTPDGKSLATACRFPAPIRRNYPLRMLGSSWNNHDPARVLQGGPVQVWNVASGRMESDLLPNLPLTATCLALSSNGRQLTVGTNGGVVWRWPLTGTRAPESLFTSKAAADYWKLVKVAQQGLALLPIQQPLTPDFHEPVGGLALSPDNKHLAAIAPGKRILLWSARGTKNPEVLTLDGEARCIAFAPNGEVLAVGIGDGVRLYDLARQSWQALDAGGTAVLSLAFSPRGKYVAMGDRNWRIYLWDLETGQALKPLIGHTAEVVTLAFSPDEQILASGGWDGRVRLWNVPSQAELITLPQQSGKVHALAFSPDGCCLASAGEAATGEGEVYLWPAAPPRGTKEQHVSH